MNSPHMTQFDNMGMFEFDDFYQRERVQRQMHDLMSSIAKSSNFTVGELKAVTQAIGKLKPKLDVGDVVDMEGAQAELTAQQDEIYQQQLEKKKDKESTFKARSCRIKSRRSSTNISIAWSRIFV